MKKLFPFLFFLFALLQSIFAQQVKPYPRSNANQVQQDNSTYIKNFLALPHGPATFPAYVPDSIKNGALRTDTAREKLQRYNKHNHQYEDVNPDTGFLSKNFKNNGHTRDSAIDLADTVRIRNLILQLILGRGPGDSVLTIKNNFVHKTAAPYSKAQSDSAFQVKLGFTPYNATNPDGYISGISGISAGGDLSGTFPNPTVSQINGITKGYYDPSSSIQTQLNGKQAALGFTPYNSTNPSGYISGISGISAGGDLSGTFPNPAVNLINGITKSYYDPSSSIQTQLNGKQATLVSATNIKTVNGNSLVGSGDLTISSGGSSLVPTALKTANYTASVSDFIPVNTTSGNITITLPSGPADKSVIAVKHIIQGGTNTVTIAAAGSDVFNKTSGSTTLTLTLVNQGVQLQYSAFSAVWYVFSDDIPLAGLDSRYVPQSLTANTTILNNGHSLTVDSLKPTQITSNITNIGSNRYLVWCGDSYTAGTGALDTAHCFAALVSHSLGLGYINNGVAGTTVVTFPTTNIPTKTAGMYKLFLEWGVNDARVTSYTSTQFQTDYTTLVNYALAHGWSGSDLVFINISGEVQNGSYPTYISQFIAFNTVIQNLATANGSTYVDIYNPLASSLYGGVIFISFDGLHVNNFGQEAIKWQILQSLSPTFILGTQAALFGKRVDLTTVTLKDYAATNNSYPLGADSLGHLHPIVQFKDNQRTGRLILGGNLIGINAFIPTTYDHVKDWILPGSGMIRSGNSNGVASYEPFDLGTGTTNWYDTFVSAGYGWYFGPSNTQALGINSSGILQPYFGIRFPNLNGSFLECVGSGTGHIDLLTATGKSTIKNSFNQGNIQIFNSDGVNNTNVQTWDFDPHGRMVGQDGGTFVANNNVRLAVNSTTEGVIFPRMTTIQRNLMGQVLVGEGPGSLGGNLYTSTPTVTFSAPAAGGTTATGTANLATGSISSVTMTNVGSGYNAPPIVTVTGGGGSGANILPTITLSSGLLIFNTTLGVYQVYNATTASWDSLIPNNADSPTSVAINSTATATAAQMQSRYITCTSASAETITTATATALATQMGAVRGYSFYETIDNTAGANTVTLALDASFTQLPGVSTSLTVPSGTTGIGTWKITFVSTTAATISRIE